MLPLLSFVLSGQGLGKPERREGGGQALYMPCLQRELGVVHGCGKAVACTRSGHGIYLLMYFLIVRDYLAEGLLG